MGWQEHSEEELHRQAPLSSPTIDMPFYLAIPRQSTFSGAVQKGSMTKSDFVRTQPSQLLYNIVSEISGPLYPLLSSRLDTVYLAHARALEFGGPVKQTFNNHFVYPPCTTAELPNLSLPKVQVRFKGPPSETSQAIIDKVGADVKKLKGMQTDTYVFRPDNMEHFADLMSLENVDDNFKPTEGAISVPQIEHLALLYTRINVVAATLRLISPFTRNRLEVITEYDVPVLPPTEVIEEMSTEDAPAVTSRDPSILHNAYEFLDSLSSSGKTARATNPYGSHQE